MCLWQHACHREVAKISTGPFIIKCKKHRDNARSIDFRNNTATGHVTGEGAAEALRGSREGWARGFTRRLRKESPNSAAPKNPEKPFTADLLWPSSDYFHIHKAPDAALSAIHMVTPHQTAKWRAHHIQQPHSPPSCYLSACAASHGGSSSPTQTPCSGS